jgi:hypothetical protein
VWDRFRTDWDFCCAVQETPMIVNGLGGWWALSTNNSSSMKQCFPDTEGAKSENATFPWPVKSRSIVTLTTGSMIFQWSSI